MVTGEILTRFNSVTAATRMQLPALTEPGSDEEHLDAAIDWLCYSSDVSADDGSAATYNLVLGWEDQYPETTGYIVPTLYEYADRTGDQERFERATAMAEWLLDIQHANGSFPGGTGTSGDPNVFNTGQIILGLTEAYRQTGREAFRAGAERACDWLVRTQDEDGSWSQYDYRSTTHVYTTRVAWALLEASTIVEESRSYEAAARKNLSWAHSHRNDNGWFSNAAFQPGDDPFLHTLAYTIRGLLEGSQHLDDDALFQAAKESADTLLELQQADGILKGAYSDDWSPSWYYCLPGNAQMGLVWYRLYELTDDRQYLLAARSTAEFLKHHQPLTGPPTVRGGLPGSHPYVGRYIFLRYPNWGAKFLADLLLSLTSDAVGATATTEPQSDTCRVCLLVDGEYVERWAADAIEQMLAETNAELSLVVLNEDSGFLSSENLKRGRKYPAYATFRVAKMLLDSTEDDAYDAAVHISDIPGVADAEWLRTYPANVEGLRSELPAEVTGEVADRADLVVRRGFGLVRGDILTATDHGVLSYHHGDPRAYRGGPAGFWEFVHDEPTAGMMVQTLRDDLDAGVVQASDEVAISDCESWEAVQQRLYNESTHLLAAAVETVQDPDAEPMRVEDLGPVYHPPSATELVRFFGKTLSERR